MVIETFFGSLGILPRKEFSDMIIIVIQAAEQFYTPLTMIGSCP